MKNMFKIAITFFMVINFMQAQQSQHRPSELVKQQKTQGSDFQDVKLFSLMTAKQKSNVQLPKEVKDYTLFSLDAKKMASIKSNAPKAMNLEIPGQKSSMVLELVKVDIATDDFKIVEMPSGNVVKSDKTVSHYRGVVRGKTNSIAAISLLDGEVSGVISIGGENGNLVMGRLENSSKHIMYEDNNLIHLQDFTCNTEANYEGYTKEELSDNPSTSKAAEKCVKVYFDIGNDVVRDKGGSQQASDYLQSIFNQVAILYSNDNVTVKISQINAWTSQNPFSGLSDYSRYRRQNGLNGADLGHFVTYDFSGGVAYLSGVCQSNYRFAVSGINKTFNNVPTYSFSVMVIAHEMGHNLGSNHTQACVWNGNNTAIDGCYNVEGSCSRPAIPSDGGTIMSYCHLTSAGINFTKGFGPQPGNVIRNTISSSSCLQTCSTTGCNTGDSATVTFNNNTDCTLEYFTNNSSQFSINSGQTRQVSTTRGASWEAKNSSNATVDSFTVQCSQDSYASTGNCTDGGITCEGVQPYSSGTVYSVGDRVTYQGNLYERTSTGWKNLGPCPTDPNDPCAGVQPYSSGTVYSVGDRVTYQGSLYERTSTGWRNLGPCGSATQASLQRGGISGELSIKAYPNPADEILTIEVSNVLNTSSTLSIKDINGRVLKVVDLDTTPGGKDRHTIDISTFSPGMYFVQVTDSKKTITKKISIK
ncbi:M12 family metallo-peptidase [Aquimarina megaterium]|uniref:M12 family metallo-peptidase n=1 Tax=Aquimarina megaterium TaxID=1443666 RepID=UPI000471CB0D|nr:M12 family metallo-peptidase [Aquimarina megaterium]